LSFDFLKEWVFEVGLINYKMFNVFSSTIWLDSWLNCIFIFVYYFNFLVRRLIFLELGCILIEQCGLFSHRPIEIKGWVIIHFNLTYLWFVLLERLRRSPFVHFVDLVLFICLSTWELLERLTLPFNNHVVDLIRQYIILFLELVFLFFDFLIFLTQWSNEIVL